MRALRRLYWGETEIDFVGRARVWFTISAALIVIAVAGLVVRGLNLSLEFTGGTAWVVDKKGFTGGDAEAAVASFKLGSDTKVQEVGGASVRIEAKEVEPDKAQEVAKALAKAAGVAEKDVSKQSVGPSWGQEVSRKALWGLVVFLVLVIIYISLRFEFKMAGTAIAELVHDMVLIVGIYAIAGFPVSPATVIAILTMLGYSLYDAVVVFDKVRENAPMLASGKQTYSDIVNLSMNQVLSRSLATSVTSFLPAASLLFVGSFLLGAATLQDLSLALVVGIASGTYSSIFFASPILARWKESEPRLRQARERIERKRATDAGQTLPESSKGAKGGGGRGGPAGPATKQQPSVATGRSKKAVKAVREAPAEVVIGTDEPTAATATAGSTTAGRSGTSSSGPKKRKRHGRQTAPSKKRH